MDLRRNDFDGLRALATVWKTTPGAELETAVKSLDITGWQDIIQGLRALGMREAPQIVKLNITLQNDIRFTLEGAGVIQAYCEDNRLNDKPFVAMVKESVPGATPVDIDYYGIRAKLKRETPLGADDSRVKDALTRWPSLIKYYRMIQRFEFVAPGGLGIRFDISVIRSGGSKTSRTFQEARVTAAPSTYEAEVELTATRDSMTADAAAALVIRGTSWMLQGLQRSFVLVSSRGSRSIIDSLQGIFSGSRNSNRGRPFKYPGPQPATLERQNIDQVAEPGIANLRTVSYNVTDKADGLRCILYVADNGRIFLIDSIGRVYGTDKEEKSQAGLVLDGEWIRRDRKGAVVSHYYAFDVMAINGKTDIAAAPFMIPGSMKTEVTRHSAMAAAITVLSGARSIIRVPAQHALQVGMKSFRTAENIFRDAAAVCLDDAKSAPYNTDGLIFTPNAAGLPLGNGTWAAQLKWKPASHNTIDFLVVIETERGADGSPLINGPDQITTKAREDTGSTVRLKTLRLFVGSRKDAAFADPRMTVLSGEPLPSSLEDGDYRAVEFRPSEPRDPMAAICYVAIGEGGDDPAGAAPAATRLDTETEIRCESGDAIQSNMIVEMSYHPERAPGWRWVPMRIRHDKTEKLRSRGVGGTMNADWVANSIWSSLHNPVTEDMVKTGEIVEICASSTAVGPSTGRYYNRKAPRRDLMRTQCMRNFHNDYVKRDILLRRTIRAGDRLCDLAMGKAGDLHKWVSAGVGYVFGCDYSAANINDPQDGAYARLLSKMIEMGGRDKVAPMVFVQSDAAVPLKSDAAGITMEDKELIRREITADASFDVVSCMFALHYMFRDEATLHGFMTNLADLVKVGGYFVGCGFDGDAVASLLAAQESVTGSDGGTDVWTITKRYGSAALSPSAASLGMAIDVDFISIGETHTEYLVSWEYLKEKAAEVGLELLTAEDLASLGLGASTQMFKDALESAGKRYDMSDALKRYSFLNRWYIFRRVADRRPEPLSVTAVRPPQLTEVAQVPSTPSTQVLGASMAPSVVPVMAPNVSVPTNVPQLVVSEVVGPVPITEVAQPQEGAPFLISASAAPDQRLGPELADWSRYMSLGTLVPLEDKFSSVGVTFPSVEAAIAAAKFQVATDKPELGATIFSTGSALSQKFEVLRGGLVGNAEALAKSVDDQVAQTRILSGAAKMKGLGAKWSPADWDKRKEEVYRVYLQQRYEVDARFRDIIKAIKETGGQIMLVNGKDYNELGVGVRADGTLAGGDNKVGKIMMSLTD